MSINNLRLALFDTATPEYSLNNLAGSSTPSCPVYASKMKSVAKTFAADDSFEPSSIPLNECVELDMVYFIIGLTRSKDFASQLQFIEGNAYRATSWMVTDTVNQYFKKPKYDLWVPFFERMIARDDVFSRRFAYLTALKFYKTKECFDLVSKHLLKDDRYYVMMMEAWLLASFAIYFPDEIYALLESDKLTVACKRKTVSKMNDSYRIRKEYKERAKALRLKWKDNS